MKEKVFNRKFNNMLMRIYDELKSTASVYGYNYIIQLLIGHKKLIKRDYTTDELLSFNGIKESISKRIADDLKAKTFNKDELIKLIGLLLYPRNQETIFESSKIINKNEVTGLLYFFYKLYWEKIIEEKLMIEDDVYLRYLNNILKYTVMIRQKKWYKNKDDYKIVCCPFYITTFVIRVILLKKVDTKEYYVDLIEETFKNNDVIKLLMLYIVFTISHEMRAIKDDKKIIDLHTQDNYMQLRDYILEYDWTELKFSGEHIILDFCLKNTIESIIKDFSENIDTDCEEIDLLDFQDISGEETDNDPYWIEKRKKIENLFDEVFVNANRKI